MERELPEDLQDYIEEMQEEEPVVIERADFIGRSMQELDMLSIQNEITTVGINRTIGKLNRAKMFEEDKDFNVTYLEMPDGSVNFMAEPITRGRLGFNEN